MFGEHFPVRKARAHEACGPGAAAFAAIVCGRGDMALWLAESHAQERLHPAGLAEFYDPGRVLFAFSVHQTEVLAAAEEALRSGAVSTVVAELSRPVSLTEGRRLQLAAETGGVTCISIIPEGMGSNAADTRWRCTPRFGARDSTLQRWELIKNKYGTLSAWDVRWDAEAHRVIVVSEDGE